MSNLRETLISSFRPFGASAAARPVAWDDEKDKKDSRAEDEKEKDRAEDEDEKKRGAAKRRAAEDEEKDDKKDDKKDAKSKAADDEKKEDDDESDKKDSKSSGKGKAADHGDEHNDGEKGSAAAERRRILNVLAWACPNPSGRLRSAIANLCIPGLSALDVITLVEANLGPDADEKPAAQPQSRGNLRERMEAVKTPVVGQGGGKDEAPSLAQQIVMADRKARGVKVA